MMTTQKRFEDKIERITESGCWVWMAYVDKDGYGIFRFNGKMQRAHRVSYALHIKQPPEDLLVCHSCDNPSCVNPNHLFLGTDQDNVVDRDKKGRHKNQNTDKTHCIKGHSLNGENLYTYPSGKRECRQCRKERLDYSRIN